MNVLSIIAVHGLGSNVDWSWTWKGSKPGTCVNWLKDLDMLPKIIPKSRIMVYNYDSKWHLHASKTRLQLCGEHLVHSTHQYRNGIDRPIIFIGHSLGGNVIQNVGSWAWTHDCHSHHSQANHHLLNRHYYMLTVKTNITTFPVLPSAWYFWVLLFGALKCKPLPTLQLSSWLSQAHIKISSMTWIMIVPRSLINCIVSVSFKKRSWYQYPVFLSSMRLTMEKRSDYLDVSKGQ